MRLVTGEVPEQVQDAFLVARLNGIWKADKKGVRVLGCGGAIRRLLGRAVAKEFKEYVKGIVGEGQFGLQPDGTGRLHRYLCAFMAANKAERLIASVDIEDAFMRIDREEALEIIKEVAPDLASIAMAWIKSTQEHVLTGREGKTAWVKQQNGFDQGCPLSPMFLSSRYAGQLKRRR